MRALIACLILISLLPLAACGCTAAPQDPLGAFARDFALQALAAWLL